MIKRIILLGVGLYMFLLVGFYLFQEKVIFRPKKLDKNFTYSFEKEFEEVNLNTDDNSIINALHFKVKNPKGVILYFHGNKDNLQRWGKIVSPYTDYDYDVFVMDYRGYGKSTGIRNEKKLYKDAMMCYDYIKGSYAENDIVIYGRSIGATFATYIASINNPKHLILEAPFYNLAQTANFHYPLSPTFLLKYKFRSNEYIPNVTCPITIFHGDKDKVISLKSGKKLYKVSNKDRSKFVIIKNGTHHNLMAFDLYKEKMASLLK